MPKENLPEIPEYLTTNRLLYSVDGKEIRLRNVKLYLKDPTEITIEAESEEHGGVKKYPDYRSSLKFRTNEGWDVEIDNLFINKVSTRMEVGKPITVNITANTTKLKAIKGEAGEEEVKVYLPIGDFDWFSGRDPENPMFKLGYIQFEPVSLADTKFYELNQPNIEGYSAILIYKGSLNMARGFLQNTWDDFYWLISLGLGQRAIASHKFIRYKNGLEVEIIPASKQKAFYGPLNFYGYNKIDSYINSSLGSYIKYKSELDIQKAIDWYILMNQTSFYHLKYLIGVVLLETLKHRFAKNIKHYKQNKFNRFLNADGKTIPPKKLLEEIQRYFSSPDGRFIELFYRFRNQMVHEGGFSEESGFRFGDAFVLQNSIARLLFKILGYEGEIEEQEFCEF